MSATAPRDVAVRVRSLVLLVVGATAGVALTAQAPVRPPAAPAAPAVAIVGGKVYPVSGPPVENGTVVMADGKITAVGAGVTIPPGAETIDAKGKWVTPGLINAATALGLVEIGAVPDTNDVRARGDRSVAAAFRAWEGLNPDSVSWAPARQDGVTGVVVLPGGGLLGGQGAFVETLEAPVAEMVRRAPVAMVANLAARAADTTARGELFLRLREVLEDARAYRARKTAFEAGGTRDFSTGRLHLEALGPVLDGKLPLAVSVDRASDIESAIGLAREYSLRLVVLGGAEAWKMAPRLAAAKVPVVTTALDNLPGDFSSLGSRQENAALLRSAGVPIAIVAGQGESFNVRNVRQHAGNAVAYGLPWEEALRAVTLAPAEIFGVDASVGSLQPGRDATVVVWDGDPLELTSRAVRVFVRGRESQAQSRQDLLTERYTRRLPRQ